MSAAKPLVPSGANRWWLDLLVLGALWGASFLFMRLGAPEFGALPTAALRVAVASLFLLPLLCWPKRKLRPAVMTVSATAIIPAPPRKPRHTA